MSRLTLIRLTRSNTQSLLDNALIEIRFIEQRVWGPHPVPSGVSFDLVSPPPGVPAATTAGPYNTNTAELQLLVQVMLGEATVMLPIPTQTTPVNPNPVGAIPLGPGQRTLVYSFGNASYVLDYRVDGDFGDATVAFLVGTGNAFVTFLTTLGTLIVSYVQSIVFLVSRLFRRPRSRGNDRIDRG